MSAVPKRKLTVDEYLEIESKAEYKSEFYNGEMFAMGPTSRNHNRVKDNFAFRVGTLLFNEPYHVCSSDTRVFVPSTGLFTYPDATVVCEAADYLSEETDTLKNPILIVEVLSKSTENYDRSTKFEHYQSIESLREYLLLAQDRIRIERFVRQENGDWTLKTFSDPEGYLEFGSFPFNIATSDIYRGVKVDGENSILRMRTE